VKAWSLPDSRLKRLEGSQLCDTCRPSDMCGTIAHRDETSGTPLLSASSRLDARSFRTRSRAPNTAATSLSETIRLVEGEPPNTKMDYHIL